MALVVTTEGSSLTRRGPDRLHADQAGRLQVPEGRSSSATRWPARRPASCRSSSCASRTGTARPDRSTSAARTVSRQLTPTMSRSRIRLRPRREPGRAADITQGEIMAKYLLLKHYRGAPAGVNDVPMDKWTPDEVEAHIGYMNDFANRLEKSGEFIDGQALSPDGVVGPLRRRGTSSHDRRPVCRNQGPDRRMDGHRRRQPRARSSSPVSCRPHPEQAASRSTNGWRSAPS